jgi:hypothetical protein
MIVHPSVRSGRRARPVLAALAALLGLAPPALARAEAAPLTTPAPAAARPALAAVPATPAALGIRVTALRLTAAGYMIDLRYRVTDSTRAATFLDRKQRLALVDEATGVRLAVPTTPKLGPLRQVAKGGVRTDREYFVFFANPGRQLLPGGRVTLVVGDVRIPHLAVE